MRRHTFIITTTVSSLSHGNDWQEQEAMQGSPCAQAGCPTTCLSAPPALPTSPDPPSPNLRKPELRAASRKGSDSPRAVNIYLGDLSPVQGPDPPAQGGCLDIRPGLQTSCPGREQWPRTPACPGNSVVRGPKASAARKTVRWTPGDRAQVTSLCWDL